MIRASKNLDMVSAVSHFYEAAALYQEIGDDYGRLHTLYHADFLTEFDGEWCWLRRESLRQELLAALLQLGTLLQKDGRYAQAAAVYRQAISHDNLLETAHRELMRCLAKMGEPTEAIRHYHYLTSLLQAELDAAPSPETTTLYHQLQAGKFL